MVITSTSDRSNKMSVLSILPAIRVRQRSRALSFPIVPVDIYQQAYSFSANSPFVNQPRMGENSEIGTGSSGGSIAEYLADTASVVSFSSGGNMSRTGSMVVTPGMGVSRNGGTPISTDEIERSGSYFSDATSTSSYAGSDDDESDDETGAVQEGEEEDFNSLDYISDRILQAFDAVLLDKAVVIQAQTSGLLNSTVRELQEAQEESKLKLKQTRAAFIEGLRTVREVQKDLKWVQRHVDRLKKKASVKYAKEYAEARELIPEIIEPED
ncbi:uncharacterized protein V1516DRAFT_667301 [Lipomyces oligophaga]|uniref:uncharacterized protein n=1 Tax=Lipomyces oligophaga TaxID=45792 RepID=UPI0034CE6D07